MLQEKQRTMLTKEIFLFSSSFEGEQLSALNAANKTLKKNNSSWHEVTEALNGKADHYSAGYAAGFEAGCNQNKPNHYEMLCQLKQKDQVLNDWSKLFIDNLYNHTDWQLSKKLCAVIERMYKQFCGK